VSFPESHDTPRLFEECNAGPAVVEQRYLFASLFSSGIMIPIGFEYGFKRRLSVVQTTPADYENIQHDFSDFITQVNTLKSSYQILNEEAYIHKLSVYENEKITIFLKTSVTYKERCLILINKDFSEAHKVTITDYLLLLSWEKKIEDISLSNPLGDIILMDNITLKPGEIKVLYSSIGVAVVELVETTSASSLRQAQGTSTGL
jgi:starch synthase (maltosyl-transferring)